MRYFTNISDVCFYKNQELVTNTNYIKVLSDYDDYFEIETDVAIDDVICRGWIGNIVCELRGFTVINDDEPVYTHQEFPNVLCTKRTFEVNPNEAVSWTYTFNKH